MTAFRSGTIVLNMVVGIHHDVKCSPAVPEVMVTLRTVLSYSALVVINLDNRKTV